MYTKIFSSSVKNLYKTNRLIVRRLASLESLKSNLESAPVREKSDPEWESVVGLEVHAQISANAKLFSGSGTAYLSPPNTQVSYFDAALPGTLPVLNRRCVEAGILTALALNCTVHKVSMFDRKHYFYSDLPAGYQITQQRMPLATDGRINFIVYNPNVHIVPYHHSVRLKQIQLEQDSGKSIHDDEDMTNLVDLNRAGIALMELVFEAELKDGEEASALVQELQHILRRLKTCKCFMEQGDLRVDANISVNRPNEPWGIRSEVKNISSNRSISKAIDYEIKRQINLLENGGKVINETRMFDASSGSTFAIRDKEVVQDYRFMPEPNLPPLQLCDNSDTINFREDPHIVNIDSLRKLMPVLPEEERKYLLENYNINLDQALNLVRNDLHTFYKEVVSNKCDTIIAADIILNLVAYQLREQKISIEECPVGAKAVSDLTTLISENKISVATAKSILDLLFSGDQRTSEEIVTANNWIQINDAKEVEDICRDILKSNPRQVKMYKKGKSKVVYFLLSSIQKRTDNRINITLAENTLKQLLAE